MRPVRKRGGSLISSGSSHAYLRRARSSGLSIRESGEMREMPSLERMSSPRSGWKKTKASNGVLPLRLLCGHKLMWLIIMSASFFERSIIRPLGMKLLMNSWLTSQEPFSQKEWNGSRRPLSSASLTFCSAECPAGQRSRSRYPYGWRGRGR